MKRMHLHVGVSDLDASISFYSALFAAEPTIAKPDYAKWLLDDPRVNFAISTGVHATKGVDHIGIQVETINELGEVYARLATAGRPVLEEGATTCCYAQSEKSWVADPDGVVWEAFLTNGQATVYGDKLHVASALSDRGTLEPANASATTCCAPKIA
ncbi:MAG: ArsI/CadI family heavy metal resistance metalloenzyme [Sphingomonadaceae bacterium]